MESKYSFKKIAIEIGKLAVMLFIVANIVSYIQKPELVDKNLPNMTLHPIDDNNISLQTYAGKPLILYFWGSWCPVCKLASPAIDALSHDYQVVTVAVNSGSDADVKKYMKEKNLQFPVVNDADGSISKKFNVDTFPTTFIYNEHGTNTFTEVGYTSSPSLKFKIWLSQYM